MRLNIGFSKLRGEVQSELITQFYQGGEEISQEEKGVGAIRGSSSLVQGKQDDDDDSNDNDGCDEHRGHLHQVHQRL